MTLSGQTGYVNSIVQLPNGDLASASSNKAIKVWNPRDGSLKYTLHPTQGHTLDVTSLRI